MKLLVLAFLALLLLAVPCSAQSNSTSWVQLAWNSSLSTNVITNYTVYYGVASFTYTNKVMAGTNLTASVSNLLRGATYYFSATATANTGLESTNSNEVSWTSPLPPPSPTLLRIITSN